MGGIKPARPRLLIDVSQYVSWPATSGVQRVLLHLAQGWSGTEVNGSFGFIDNGSYVTGPLVELAAVLALSFESSGDAMSSEDVRRTLHKASDQLVPTSDVETNFDAYLLPEPDSADRQSFASLATSTVVEDLHILHLITMRSH